jgi:uncharacterized protein YbjT (DUF2867 family)
MVPMSDTHHPITLVLGGTGKTGRRVASRLRARGADVRVGSRAGAPPFDWDDPGTWIDAVRGTSAAYVTYYPDLSFPTAAERIGAFADLARQQGVRRLVLLSGRGEEEAEVSEKEVQTAGTEWTVLRASLFFQNFSEHFLLEPVRSGVIALPAGGVVEPFIDADDIADVAVAALTEDGHDQTTYELTGPQLLTFGEVADTISTATGRLVTYLPVTPDEYRSAAIADGVPAEEVEPLTELFIRVFDGRNAHLTSDVERVLGRSPVDFTTFAGATAATGVWQP